MEILVPAAGLSTRYPNMRPKYLLYDYKSEIMLKNAVEQFIGTEHTVTVGILEEHAKRYDALDHIKHNLPNVNVIVLPERTKGPADTVYQILKNFEKGSNFTFLVKDCDSFFTHDVYAGNYICVSGIYQHETLHKLNAKSFVQYNDQGIITDIIEKRVVSDTFCVGGYKFDSSVRYMQAFERLSRKTDEIFVSHIIQDMMARGDTFVTNHVRDYVDVGTAEEWHKFNNKPVIFCAIDGTLIKAQSRFGKNSYYTKPTVLEENYKIIKKHHEEGSQIFFVTAREPQYEDVTRCMLRDLGFDNAVIICGVNNSARWVINDYNEANP